LERLAAVVQHLVPGAVSFWIARSAAVVLHDLEPVTGRWLA